MKEFHFHCPAEIIFGIDAIERIGLITAPFGERVLLITEQVLSEGKFPLLIQKLLIKQGIECIIFDEAGTESTSRTAEKAIAIAKGSHTQIIIGLGGIRTLSIAKCAAGFTSLSTSIDDFKGELQKKNNFLHYIEIPTTCRNPFMLKDEFLTIGNKHRETRILKIKDNFAKVVVIDPALSLTLPEKYVISTLLDTFLASIEGYFSLSSSFLSDTIFLRSIGIITSIFQEIVSDPGNMDLRLKASRAGLLSAFGLIMGSQGIGSAAAYSAGGLYMVPKSFIASMMIPSILEYGSKACSGKVARMAPILNEDWGDLSTADAAERVVEVMRIKIGTQQIPMRFTDFSLKLQDITAISDSAGSFNMLKDLPTTLSKQDIFQILKKAL